MSLAATRELAELLDVDQLELLRANRDRAWRVENGVLAFESLRPGDVLRHPAGGEIQIAQMGRRPLERRAPLGMMGSIVDFQTFNQPGSQFAQAWQPVAQQIAAEGGDLTALQAAANDFTSSFEQLTSSGSGFGLDVSSALEAAKGYTIAGRTVLGSIQHVQGLIAAAQGASTPQEAAQVFQMFTGTLIGAMAAAGAVSAGVGSLIVAGIAVAMDLLQSSGLFGTAPSGTLVCSVGQAQLRSNNPPTVQVGCAFSTTASVVNAGSANWRAFPSPSSSTPGDRDWFTSDHASWRGDDWGGWFNQRLIDSAFPVWHYMACAEQPSELSMFHTAFVQAWKANAEYALNGLKAQEDAQVLLHLARVWNRAHTSTSYYDLTPATFQLGSPAYIYKPTLAEIAAGHTQNGGSLCSSTGFQSGPPIPFYEAVLMNRVRDLVGSDDAANSMVGGNLRIHTGPPEPVLKNVNGAIYQWDGSRNEWTQLLSAQQVTDLEAGIAAALAKVHTTTPAAGMSTGAKAAIGVGAVAVGAGGLWLLLGKPLTVEAFKFAFSKWLEKL